MVICNLLEEDAWQNSSLCLQNILLHNSHRYCVLDYVKYQNNVISLNETSISCSIVEPTTITFLCSEGKELKRIELFNNEVISRPTTKTPFSSIFSGKESKRLKIKLE